MRVAFGPRTAAPSWEWVGLDTARELEKDFEIGFFDGFERIPPVDLIAVIKEKPPSSFLDTVHASGAKLVYAPIDRYVSEQEIREDADFLGACDLVLLHSEALAPCVKPLCRRVRFVEHHLRYALDTPAAFKPSGYVLWIGACEHIPHIVRWLETNPLPTHVRLLTNFDNRAARIKAHITAHDIGVRLRFADDTVNGYRLHRWSEPMQRTMMRECKAAIDIKGADFNQSTKPPTKAQQFVASSIPFGCNPDTSVSSYFRNHGFDLVDPADADRLLSAEYYAETCAFSGKLRQRLSRKTVGGVYRREFSALLDMAPVAKA